jgi:hypothetical protein
MTDTEIAKYHGITTTELRARKSIGNARAKQDNILQAEKLREKGYGYTEIGKIMGKPESSVRALLAPGEKDKAGAVQTTANMLRDHVDRKKYVDIGRGTEIQLGVTTTRMNTAVAVLKEEGYQVHSIQQPQLSSANQFTRQKILVKPGISLAEVNANRGNIQQIHDYSEDNGRTFFKPEPPLNISSKRIAINYKEDGGDKADGVIYVRPGVKDLDMGESRYSQVRIAVDGTHYLKGMAVYKDDLPHGVDLVFNTNKSNTGNKKDALKPLKDDPTNPFGAITRQVRDPKTGKVTSAMNKVGAKEGAGEEGAWDTWSRNLPSQMLSKQSPDLARQQLGVTYERRKKEFEEISSLTNPTVRQELLMKFADSTDSAAVHLKAAALPKQSTKVLMPVPSMKEHEIYIPSLNNGDRVALVRFPHAGPFEIPQLTVNNKNREARALLGSAAVDTVGVHHKVAERLSGADFDGDTVLVIPNHSGLVKSAPALEGLKDFDPKKYKLPADSPLLKDPKKLAADKQKQMGRVSNLITDMSLQGASSDHLSRAVRHSMVVIDSEKHELDIKASEKDNNIRELKQRYQGGGNRGASTLLSKANATVRIDEKRLRKPSQGGPIDLKTGEKVFVPTGRTRAERRVVVDPVTKQRTFVETGARIPIQVKSKQLAETNDAFSLTTKPIPHTMEVIYAEHSNRLKSLANQARLEAVHTKATPYDPNAKTVYSKEVTSLNSKLALAKANAPLERHAQRLAQQAVSVKRQANPHMDEDDVKKLKQIELTNARIATGAAKHRVSVTQEEWNAIQAGAVSTTKLKEILTNSDIDSVKKLALPKKAKLMTTTAKARAQTMLKSGYTQAEVADALGVGVTTLKVALEEG